MIRCYLTTVQFPLEKGYVLNRRAALELLHLLRKRVSSLQRMIEQLSPLDDQTENAWHPPRRAHPATRQHRLVCKAVADALSPGFPEISLFLTWPEYRSHVREKLRQDVPGKEQPEPENSTRKRNEDKLPP